MEAILKEINSVLGVTGSFVCLSDGSLAAQAMPERFDDARLALVARVGSQTFQALEVSGQRVTEADLLYGQDRLILKNLRGGILVILCTRNISIPLLNLTANIAVKKLNAELKPAKTPTAPLPTGAPRPAPAPATAATGGTAVEVTPSPLLSEIEQQVHRVIDAAEKAHVTLRAMDPVAVWLCCPHTRTLLLTPERRQIDFAGLAAQSKAISRLFEQLGYEANQRFNALQGNRHLNFVEAQRDLNTDIFLDAFDMYHRLDLKGFMAEEGTALPETALLLMRLQLVEMNDAGLRDLCALLLEHDLSVGPEREKIDVWQITRLCADDWGWFKTVSMNLDRITSFAPTALTPSEEAVVIERVRRLKKSIEDAPKTLRWQTRARVGESVRWYETPIWPSQTARSNPATG